VASGVSEVAGAMAVSVIGLFAGAARFFVGKSAFGHILIIALEVDRKY
jgi:hypothetical protein